MLKPFVCTSTWLQKRLKLPMAVPMKTLLPAQEQAVPFLRDTSRLDPPSQRLPDTSSTNELGMILRRRCTALPLHSETSTPNERLLEFDAGQVLRAGPLEEPIPSTNRLEGLREEVSRRATSWAIDRVVPSLIQRQRHRNLRLNRCRRVRVHPISGYIQMFEGQYMPPSLE